MKTILRRCVNVLLSICVTSTFEHYWFSMYWLLGYLWCIALTLSTIFTPRRITNVCRFNNSHVALTNAQLFALHAKCRTEYTLLGRLFVHTATALLAQFCVDRYFRARSIALDLLLFCSQLIRSPFTLAHILQQCLILTFVTFVPLLGPTVLVNQHWHPFCHNHVYALLIFYFDVIVCTR